MIVIHWSDPSLYAVGGPYEPTAANFPWAQHFFKCNEAASTLTLADSIGNIVLSGPTAFGKTDAFSIKAVTGSARTSAGAWASLATAGFGLFAVGKFGVTLFTIGGVVNGNYISLSAIASNALIIESTDTGAYVGADFTLNTAATIYGRANVVSAFNTGSGQQTYEFDTSATASLIGNSPTDATSGGGSAMSAGPVFNTGAASWNLNANTDVYGILIFKFSAIPATLKTGLAWMTKQWSLGNKWFPPYWKGLA